MIFKKKMFALSIMFSFMVGLFGNYNIAFAVPPAAYYGVVLSNEGPQTDVMTGVLTGFFGAEGESWYQDVTMPATTSIDQVDVMLGYVPADPTALCYLHMVVFPNAPTTYEPGNEFTSTAVTLAELDSDPLVGWKSFVFDPPATVPVGDEVTFYFFCLLPPYDGTAAFDAGTLSYALDENNGYADGAFQLAWPPVVDNTYDLLFRIFGEITGEQPVPADVTATANGQTSVLLSWSANGNLEDASYVVYNNTLEEEAGTTDSTSFTVTGLTPDTSYEFSVRAVHNIDPEYVAPYSDVSNSVTTAAISDEVVMTLEVGGTGSYSFPVAPETSHTVTLDSIVAGLATMTIESDPVVVALEQGESENIDTNGDGVDDTMVTMDNVGDSSATFTLSYVTPPVVASSGGGVPLLLPVITSAPSSNTPSTEDTSSPSTSGDGATSFSDTVGHWASDYVDNLYEMEVIEGKMVDGKKVFAPEDSVTRAEFLKMVLLASGATINDSEITPFTDVDAGAWYAPYVKTAKDLGIIEGYENGTFRPNDTINRVEALSMILKAFGVDINFDASFTFPDTSSAAWYADYISFAVENEIVKGYENGNFGPSDALSRAQTAKVIVLVMMLGS
ncbi:hypothetical protein CVV38_02690 [Candidatus Peregrinibacteria bacterium HGW-Peregrinibacteria-1]|jgi:hypothetical protein|nr:MAG: hypothetical protein CVV38_02690 [Candidatus Peregrinibacteria bacterium HGW-Peregrinibacteria-1]